VFVVIIFISFKETRGSILLSQKARTLNKYYKKLEEAGYYGVVMSAGEVGEQQRIHRIRWKVKGDEERESLAKMISISCYRPFRESTIILSDSHVTINHPTTSPLHGTSRLLLFALGIFQLGCSLPAVRFHSIGF
jgi:hypothetical protein